MIMVTMELSIINVSKKLILKFISFIVSYLKLQHFQLSVLQGIE